MYRFWMKALMIYDTDDTWHLVLCTEMFSYQGLPEMNSEIIIKSTLGLEIFHFSGDYSGNLHRGIMPSLKSKPTETLLKLYCIVEKMSLHQANSSSHSSCKEQCWRIILTTEMGHFECSKLTPNCVTSKSFVLN